MLIVEHIIDEIIAESSMKISNTDSVILKTLVINELTILSISNKSSNLGQIVASRLISILRRMQQDNNEKRFIDLFQIKINNLFFIITNRYLKEKHERNLSICFGLKAHVKNNLIFPVPFITYQPLNIIVFYKMQTDCISILLREYKPFAKNMLMRIY